MFSPYLNVLRLFELPRSSNNQSFLLFYYISDVVRGFSGAIRYELAVFKDGHLEI